MIETGKLAYIKTSEEPVLVMDILAEDTGAFPSLEQTLVTVRRPVAGQNGIEHSTERFYLDELETLEEKIKRQFEEVKTSRQVVQGNSGQVIDAGMFDDPAMKVN